MRITSLSKFFLWTAVIALGVIFASALNVTKAQEGVVGNGFRISPLRHELTIEKGKSDVFTFSLQNVTSAPLIATPVINDFTSDDASGEPQIIVNPDDVQPTTIKPFINSLETYTLEPGENVNIQVPVVIPVDTAPGSYYGLLRYSASPATNDSPDTTEISLAASIGTLVFISVPGDTIELATVEDLGVLKDGRQSSFFSSAPNEAIVKIANQGNTFIKVFGDVRVKDWRGNEIYSYQLNPEPRGITLPDSTREFKNPIENIGSFGRYTIEANVAYGDGGSVATVESQFWVIPWVPILIVTAILIGIVFFSTRGLKSYNKMVVDKSKKKDY